MNITKLTVDSAFEILKEMVTNDGLRKHCLAVARVMEAVAKANNEDESKFFIAGILHDSDWELWPEKHPQVIVDKLNNLGENEIAYAISSHGTEFNVEQKSLMDRSLIAADEITGLIMAVSKLRPDGLSSLTTSSVIKKFRDTKFAAGVSRNEINMAMKILGVKLEPWIQFIIDSLKPFSEELGLPKVETNLNNAVFPEMIKAVSNESGDSKTIKKRLSDEQIIRIQKRENLNNLGIDPYPGSTYPVDTYSVDVLASHKSIGEDVCMAGRLMSIRNQGKVCFAELQDSKGKLQLYFSKDILEDDYKIFKTLIDRGDFIGVVGKIFLTKTNELTIEVKKFTCITKALRPLPSVKSAKNNLGENEIFDSFSDPELRFRQRYVDLIINPHVREIFIKRTRIVDIIRTLWNSKGWYEAQTPILQAIYGGASARPFITHHNALDMPMYLRIANELYLKRLLVGGFEGVYEFSVDFRNEGMDKTHNPEFQQVELYVSYKDYNWMMDLVEETIEKVCMEINCTTEIEIWGNQVSFKKPWRRVSIRDLIFEKNEIDIYQHNEQSLREEIIKKGVPIEGIQGIIGKGKLIDELFSETVEKFLIQPTFVTDYPVELSPLAKRNPHDYSLTHRFEAYCVGKEFANAFSELNDPIDQRERFEEQLRLATRGDKEAMNEMDEDFLRALEYGMPSAAGLGLGIDRLTMLMTNQSSIQEVILFPMMRPEN
ncbi:lysine--tRNA ligase [Arcicella sp. DC2W]|uniref:Lysine--tRNA ligase n=1 Tax=Arcicella gelida TaxID=2984195 RepID=A0ABU5S0U8_9BACT|nr:lysine--tRNA ligase [Arcicella sp. DC2W]MEA5402102.1 lysine--tRNA ligase [Arcicella sp. DC2W]